MKARREWNLIELMLENTMQEVLDELCSKYEGEKFDHIDYRQLYYVDSDRFYKEDGTYKTVEIRTYYLTTDECSYKNLYTIVEDRLLLNAENKRNPIIYVEGFDVKGSQIEIHMGVDYLD
jgi:hypothetical protein